MSKKIGIIGQFAPPMHGLAKALDTLYNSYLGSKFELYKINITDNKKILINLFKVIFTKMDLYYLTISQSKLGNIRDLIIIKLIQIKNRKILLHLHGGGFRHAIDEEFSTFQRKMNYRILSKVDGVIVLGDSLRYIFEGIVSEKKIHVVKNCVDNNFIISDEEFYKKNKLLESKKELKILYLSNFIEDKGYKEVLNLSKFVNSNNDNKYKFIFAGNFFCEKDKMEFIKYISENKLEDIVEYRGVVVGKDKIDVLKECDMFILLTKYKNEGQPISIIEAAANGLMVITTKHAGIGDILDYDNMISLNKENIDINDLYLKINNNCKNRLNFRRKITQNREYVLKHFSEESYLNEIFDIFDKNL